MLPRCTLFRCRDLSFPAGRVQKSSPLWWFCPPTRPPMISLYFLLQTIIATTLSYSTNTYCLCTLIPHPLIPSPSPPNIPIPSTGCPSLLHLPTIYTHLPSPSTPSPLTHIHHDPRKQKAHNPSQAEKEAKASAKAAPNVTARSSATTSKASPNPPSAVSPVVEASSVSLPVRIPFPPFLLASLSKKKAQFRSKP